MARTKIGGISLGEISHVADGLCDGYNLSRASDRISNSQ